MPFAGFAQPNKLGALALVEQQLVAGLRHWATAQRLGCSPVAALRDHLGCGRAAAHLQLLIEEIGLAWPDPFALAPLCCDRLSHDEALIASMLSAATDRDRPAFDFQTREMLGADARERLFLTLGVLGRAIAAAPQTLEAGRG